jgi:hypothetical protein
MGKPAGRMRNEWDAYVCFLVLFFLSVFGSPQLMPSRQRQDKGGGGGGRLHTQIQNKQKNKTMGSCGDYWALNMSFYPAGSGCGEQRWVNCHKF